MFVTTHHTEFVCWRHTNTRRLSSDKNKTKIPQPQLRVLDCNGCAGLQHSNRVCEKHTQLRLLSSHILLPCYISYSLRCRIRVSNELGANRPKEAKFAVLVAVSTSMFMGAVFMCVVLIWRTSLPKLFSDSEEVKRGASKLGHLLALTVCVSSIWPVLSGRQFFALESGLWTRHARLPANSCAQGSCLFSFRRGRRSWVASACGDHKRRLLLPSGHSDGYPAWVQAKTRHNGKLKSS